MAQNKEQQKQLLIEIMNEDEKNRIYEPTLKEIEKMAENQWEGCHHCTEDDKQMWINGFITGYLTAKNS